MQALGALLHNPEQLAHRALARSSCVTTLGCTTTQMFSSKMHQTLEASGFNAARTYPGALPLLRLDRIYARGFSVVRAEVRHGLPWSRISDHAALSAELELS